MTSPKPADDRSATDLVPPTEEVPPLDKTPDAPTAVDAALHSTHDRLENLDRRDEKANLLKSIEAFDQPGRADNSFLKVIRTVLSQKEMPKTSQQIMIQHLIDFFLQETRAKFAINELINSDFLQKTYGALLAYRTYFEELIAQNGENETWYSGTLRIVAEEAAKAFEIYKSSDNLSIYRAKDFSNRLSLMEELHRVAPISDYESKHQKGVAVITDILNQLMKRRFWEPHGPNDQQQDYDEIKELAQKWEITLPTEEEVWARDVHDTVHRIEKNLNEMEVRQSNGRIVDRLGTGSNEEIGPMIDFLQEAAQRFSTLKCEKIPSFQARLETIVQNNVLFSFNQKIADFEEALTSGQMQKITDATRTLLVFLRERINIIRPSLAPIRERLESFKTAQTTKMQSLLYAVALDPDTAHERLREITTQAKIIEQLSKIFSDLDRLAPIETQPQDA